MKTLITLTLYSIISSSFIKAKENHHPNIILIFADDLGMGMLSHYGQTHLTTPNIDSIAKEGISFKRFYGSTFCAPSRYTLLTGMHDGHQGAGSHTPGSFIKKLDKTTQDPDQWEAVYNKHLDERKKRIVIPDSELFLAQVAKKAGYTTAQFGKLDIGFLTWHDRIKRLGWDHYVGYYDHARAHGFYPRYLWKNGEKLPLKGNTKWDAGKASENGNEPVGSHGETYSQDIFISEILDFIRTHKEKPFFIYHSTQLPHGPVAVNKLHPEVADNPDLTLSEKKYASMVKMLDEHVGLILKELKDQGIEDNTIVMFTSDNGHETYYENKKKKLPKKNKKLLTDHSKSNMTNNKWRTSNGGDIFNGAAGMAGLKWDTLEGGIHCPMFIKWPAKIKPNSNSEHLATHYDFMATLADLTGQSIPKEKNSLSYLPTLTGAKEQPTHDWIFVNFGRATKGTVITKDHWKLIQLKNGSFQLYSLKDDFKEEVNVEKQHPEIVKKLKSIFLKEQGKLRPDTATK